MRRKGRKERKEEIKICIRVVAEGFIGCVWAMFTWGSYYHSQAYQIS